MNDQPRRWLNVKKAADRCGVTPSFIYMHARDGTIPCMRIGNKILIPADELEQWIESRRVRPGMELPD